MNGKNGMEIDKVLARGFFIFKLQKHSTKGHVIVRRGNCAMFNSYSGEGCLTSKYFQEFTIVKSYVFPSLD